MPQSQLPQPLVCCIVLLLLPPPLLPAPVAAAAAAAAAPRIKPDDEMIANMRAEQQQHQQQHQQQIEEQQYTVDGLLLRSAPALQAAINRSIAAHEPVFTIATGAYYFSGGEPLLLYRARNWALRTDGGRVELWFRATSTWRTGGVLIKECDHISVSGLTVDYDPPTGYQGTVVKQVATEIIAAEAKVACYRRMDIDMPRCVNTATTDLHQYNRTTKQWSTIAGLNCYDRGHGAQIPPGPEPWPCCHDNVTGAKNPQAVTLEACKAGCSSDPSCTAIVTGPGARPSPPPPPPHGPSAGMATYLVQTDPGFPEPHDYERNHSQANDPSDDDNGNQMMICKCWPPPAFSVLPHRSGGLPSHPLSWLPASPREFHTALRLPQGRKASVLPVHLFLAHRE
jgi:hypothetical protein